LLFIYYISFFKLHNIELENSIGVETKDKLSKLSYDRNLVS